MLKKNTRKRLLAGALATVMMLTMCPSWALADDEDIALLPANEEIAVPVVDSTPAADPTETPAVPTPSEPEAKPAEDQNTAPAPPMQIAAETPAILPVPTVAASAVQSA